MARPRCQPAGRELREPQQRAERGGTVGRQPDREAGRPIVAARVEPRGRPGQAAHRHRRTTNDGVAATGVARQAREDLHAVAAADRDLPAVGGQREPGERPRTDRHHRPGARGVVADEERAARKIRAQVHAIRIVGIDAAHVHAVHAARAGVARPGDAAVVGDVDEPGVEVRVLGAHVQSLRARRRALDRQRVGVGARRRRGGPGHAVVRHRDLRRERARHGDGGGRIRDGGRPGVLDQVDDVLPGQRRGARPAAAARVADRDPVGQAQQQPAVGADDQLGVLETGGRDGLLADPGPVGAGIEGLQAGRRWCARRCGAASPGSTAICPAAGYRPFARASPAAPTSASATTAAAAPPRRFNSSARTPAARSRRWAGRRARWRRPAARTSRRSRCRCRHPTGRG